MRIPKDKVLQMENFILGMRRDGSLTQEAERDENLGANPYILHSLKTLENYDIAYEDGNLVTRDGYERWNKVVLPDNPKQIYYHTNLPRTSEFLMGIADDRWYKIQEAIAHEMVIDEDVTVADGFKKPIFSWGNRIFFATDIGWYWTDPDRLYDGIKYYQAGIDKPNDAPSIQLVDATGSHDNLHGLDLSPAILPETVILNTTTNRKLSMEYPVTNPLTIGAISVRLARPIQHLWFGNIRIKVCKDDGGKPEMTAGHVPVLADVNAISQWLPTSSVMYGQYRFVVFRFEKDFTLPAGTYWIVLEGDDNYYTNFSIDPDWALSFFVAIDYTLTIKYGDSEIYDYSTAIWSHCLVSTHHVEFAFYISGLDTLRYYDYIYTYYNSIYVIESRPSVYSRIQVTSALPVVHLYNYDRTTDPQADQVRVYRRELTVGTDPDATDEDVIASGATYNYVATFADGSDFLDTIPSESLGAEIQTYDHYKITEADDVGNVRSAIIPAGACIWKGRVWVFEANGNILYFSKKLEQDGATGLTGDPIPDYFPLTNQLELQEESAILAIRPLANDQLAVYFRNGTIYVIWGMDDVLNPPSDFSYRPMVYGLGLISSWGLTDYKSMHVYISRHGLYAFSGAPVPEYLSESVQSIIDGISDANLAKAVIIARGEDIWLLLDENDDGYNDTIYILNLQRSVKPWRRYTYNTNISDLLVKTLSSSSKDILACDDTNKYLLELNIGTTDNGAPIQSYLESHRQKVANAFIYEAEIKDLYDSNDVPASYDFLITDSNGYGKHQEINPSSNDDERGHRVGMRLRSSGSFNVRMDQISVQKTDLLGIYIRYISQ